MNLAPKATILQSYKTDHNTIELSINVSKSPRGKGTWKLNNSLLEDEELKTMIKKEINLIKSTYACTPYNPNYVETSKGEKLELMMSPRLFIETMLCQVRGIIIAFSKKKARERHKDEKELIEKIKTLELNRNEQSESLLESLKIKLDSIREHELKGMQIRSRAIMSREGEKPS